MIGACLPMPHNETSILLGEIERFLAMNPEFSAAAFGTDAVGDRHFVYDLRKGRRCWPETIEKVRDFLAARAGVTESDQPTAPEAA